MDIIESNLFQLLITGLAGCCTYVALFYILGRVLAKKQDSITRCVIREKYIFYGVLATAVVLFIVTLICFLFGLGETYSYSKWYKRSFGFFGDGFPFSLLLLAAFGVYLKSSFITLLAVGTIMLSGGRMVIVSTVLLLLYTHATHGMIVSIKKTLNIIFMSAAIYVLSILISNELSEEFQIEPNLVGRDVCEYVEKCVQTQLQAPVLQRLATSAVGFWMTLQGGYPGSAYPGTAEKFADFIMQHNPFGLNEKLGWGWSDWQRTGGVQNAYLSIGSGYGPIGLILTTIFYFYTSIIGFNGLRCNNDKSSCRALIVFFIFLSFVNQTQPWIQSGSWLLFLSGLAAAHIWRIKLKTESRSLMHA